MSSKLNLIARMAARQTPEQIPAPETGLGAQIEALVADAVKAQVADALEQQQPVRVQRLLDRQFNKPSSMPTSFEQLPPVARTPAPKNQTMLIHRDGSGAIAWAECGGMKFKAVRDGAGRIIAIEPVDESPVLPALDVPYKPEARQYFDGEPR